MDKGPISNLKFTRTGSKCKSPESIQRTLTIASAACSSVPAVLRVSGGDSATSFDSGLACICIVCRRVRRPCGTAAPPPPLFAVAFLRGISPGRCVHCCWPHGLQGCCTRLKLLFSLGSVNSPCYLIGRCVRAVSYSRPRSLAHL